MPQITEYTPAWLSQPNPGYELFTNATKEVKYPSLNGSKKSAKPGPLQTVAHRGTEIFIAVGKEIRWADLVYLKEAWEDGEKRRKNTARRGARESSQYEEDHAQGYRVRVKCCGYLCSGLTISRPSKLLSRTIFDDLLSLHTTTS